MTAQSYRPFLTDMDLSWWKRVNTVWWVQRIPIALLTIPSSYGVGAFAKEKLEEPFNWIAGVAFEAAYIGAVALADQQKDVRDRWTMILWVIVNLVAVVCSALMNTLFFADGQYARITPEAITHGVPLAILNFCYALLLHSIVSNQQKREIQKVEQATELQARQIKREETWRDTKLMLEIEREKTSAEREKTSAAIEKMRIRDAEIDLERKELTLEQRKRKVRETPGQNAGNAQSLEDSRSQTGQNAGNARILCMKCGVEVIVPDGKNPEKYRIATKRWGCDICKVKKGSTS